MQRLVIYAGRQNQNEDTLAKLDADIWINIRDMDIREEGRKGERDKVYGRNGEWEDGDVSK